MSDRIVLDGELLLINQLDGEPEKVLLKRGMDGDDGYSPTVTVTDITGGHRVTITDVDGDHVFDVMNGQDASGGLSDVQINGTSIVSQGVAEIPIASANNLGVVRYGAGLKNSGNKITISASGSQNVKAGDNMSYPIVPAFQHESVFYGLAKVAGSDEKDSSLAVGTYTDDAKTAIKAMLGVPTMSEIIQAVQDSFDDAEGVSF